MTGPFDLEPESEFVYFYDGDRNRTIAILREDLGDEECFPVPY